MVPLPFDLPPANNGRALMFKASLTASTGQQPVLFPIADGIGSNAAGAV